MHPVFGKCPVCGEDLMVTRMECRSCSTEIGGQFAIGRLHRLGAAETEFVETFVKNRGNAYKVGEELGVAYSTVRARLTEIIRALGYEPGAEKEEGAPALTAEKRKAVLDDLAGGKISTEDAIKILQGE
jgi:hypothetical protein